MAIPNTGRFPYGPDPVEIGPWEWTPEAREAVLAALPLVPGAQPEQALREIGFARSIGLALAEYRDLLAAHDRVRSWSRLETRQQLEGLRALGEQLGSVALLESTLALLDDVGLDFAFYVDTAEMAARCRRLGLLLQQRVPVALRRLDAERTPGRRFEFIERDISRKLWGAWTRYTGREISVSSNRDGRSDPGPFLRFLRATMKLVQPSFDGRRIEREIVKQQAAASATRKPKGPNRGRRESREITK